MHANPVPTPVAAEKLAPPLPLPLPASAAEQFFQVTRSCLVPGKEGPYKLPEGMVLSTRGYDVPWLLSIGVPLEPVASREVPVRAVLL